MIPREDDEVMKLGVIVLLVAAPLGLFVIAGAVWLGERSLLWPALLVVLACWGIAGWSLRRSLSRLGYPNPIPSEWTEHDREALAVIDAYEQSLQEFTSEQLADRRVQEKLVVDLASRIARHYQPDAEDALSPLTPRQLLHAAEVMIQDTSEWMDYYLPGGEHLTFGQLRRLGRLPGWTVTLGKLVAGGSRWFKPRNAAARLPGPALDAASQRAGSMMSLTVTRFLLRKVGLRLIDLYGGHLEASQPVGSNRLPNPRTASQHPRPTSQLSRPASQPPRPPTSSRNHVQTTITIIGEAGSGKTSLIRALLGPDRAIRDRLPDRNRVHRFRVQLDRPLARLVVLEADIELGSLARERPWINEHSDLVVLVCRANASMDQVGEALRLLSQADGGVNVLAAVTHLDEVVELSPAIELPLLDVAGQEAMREAVRPWQRHFAGEGFEFVPVCADLTAGRVHGIYPSLVTAIARQLGEQQSHLFLQAIEWSKHTHPPV